MYAVLLMTTVHGKDYPHGLGGASLWITCQPTSVSRGGTVGIRVAYDMDIVRPVDLHFDVLLEPEKQWLSGSKMILSDHNNGSASLNLTLPRNAPTGSRLLWKVFFTPRGDRFPNMLAETGLAPVDIVDGIVPDACPYGPPDVAIIQRPDVDFIHIEGRVHPPDPVRITYALHSRQEATLNVILADESTNKVVWASTPRPLVWMKNGQNQSTVIDLTSFPVASDRVNRFYLDASIIPIGSSWDERITGDRTYQVLL